MLDDVSSHLAAARAALDKKDNAKASEAMQAAARALGELPVGAIAGITAANAGSVIAAGADGVAVIGALFGGDDISEAARDLRLAVASALSERVAKSA